MLVTDADGPGNELTNLKGAALQYGAYNHDGGANENGSTATEYVTQPDCGNGAKEAPKSVRSDSDALLCRNAGLCTGTQAWSGRVDGGKLGTEGWESQETAHDALIISKQSAIPCR